MKIVDFHCDVLSKMLVDSNIEFNEQEARQKLDVTLERLVEANYLLQVFAIYIPAHYPKNIYPILKSISLFYDKILKHPQMRLVQTREELEQCRAEGKVGAMLSLEGVDGIDAQIYMVSLLQRLGVRFIGLTWNNMNWAADGILEARGAGLSSLGMEFVQQSYDSHMMIDVSHLSEQGFWDIVHHCKHPFIASHSNAKAICDHPRNLSDAQIAAIIDRKGMIGLTYVPWFVAKQQPHMADLMLHINHIIQLGGEDHIMLGSDFDGIDQYIPGLKQPRDVLKFQKMLQNHFHSAIIEKIMWKNAYHFLINHL